MTGEASRVPHVSMNYVVSIVGAEMTHGDRDFTADRPSSHGDVLPNAGHAYFRSGLRSRGC